MSLFKKIRDTFSRHRNKFIVGGILVSGTILLTRYAQQKLKEWQEKEMLEFLERTRKQQHYENIGRTCNQTILNLSNALFEALSKVVGTDKVVSELRTNPDDRVTVWESLKILLFVKLCCLIYSMSMLVVVLRIQMNLLGGYLYKDQNSIPKEMQEKFLSSLAQTLLNGGLNQLSIEITQVCKKLMETLDLKQPMRLSDIDSLFWSLQTAIGDSDANPIDNIKKYLSSFENGTSEGDKYSELIRDTLDFLDSDETKTLTFQCVNRGFVLLGNQLSEYYVTNGSNQEDDFNPKKPLAKLLPIINGVLTRNAFPEKLIQQLVSNEKLNLFGANIYESLL